jgi:hypothetical protein
VRPICPLFGKKELNKKRKKTPFLIPFPLLFLSKSELHKGNKKICPLLIFTWAGSKEESKLFFHLTPSQTDKKGLPSPFGKMEFPFSGNFKGKIHQFFLFPTYFHLHLKSKFDNRWFGERGALLRYPLSQIFGKNTLLVEGVEFGKEKGAESGETFNINWGFGKLGSGENF